MVAESWFRNLWRSHKKNEGPQQTIGVLAFEVASLMSKIVHLWRSLSDKQVAKLREEIANSIGIKKLISEDDDYIVRFISSEIIENLCHVAKSVSRLSKKCNDPCLKSFEHVFNELTKIGADPYAWTYTWRKMDRKIRKMERFILMNSNLYQGLESLSELDHTLMRMKANEDVDGASLVDYQKKVAWKKQEVKQLKDFSLWNRSYDYIVRVLARSVFTVFRRIGYVFGIGPVVDFYIKDDSDYIFRSQSVSTILQSSVYPSENNGISRFSSGPLLNMGTKSGPIAKTNGMSNFHSGPIARTNVPSNFHSGPIVKTNASGNFHSGPIAKMNGSGNSHSGPLAKTNVSSNFHSGPLGKSTIGSSLENNRSMNFYSGPLKPSTTRSTKPKRSVFKLWGNSRNASSKTSHFENAPAVRNSNFEMKENKQKWLNAPPETLGAAALALHYANVIIVIEKLVASPHLIGVDARDDLYNMLPFSVRTALKAKLKPYSKNLNMSIYESTLAGEWTEAMLGILEWLGPLAHNTIRWQTERSFEHQNLGSKTNVLLVQTLYFANQEKTEATITELLIGLNYVWRYDRELNAKALAECTSGRTIGSSLEVE